MLEKSDNFVSPEKWEPCRCLGGGGGALRFAIFAVWQAR